MAHAPSTGEYARIRSAFNWQIPHYFNMGTSCADRHPPRDLALVTVNTQGTVREYTFGDLSDMSNRFANALTGLGVSRGERVAVVLPQRVETGVAHLATYKLGGIAVPLSPLFGPDALRYRLVDCSARVVVTDSERLEAVIEASADIDGIRIVNVDHPTVASNGFWDLIANSSPGFTPALTTPDDPALLIYTSGTTGSPKGALHGHRVLLGHLPGFELMFDQFPQPNDVSWTPADWAWAGGLLDLLLPSWYHGRPVVGTTRDGKFDPEWAAELMQRHQVTTTFLPPSALRMFRQSDVRMTESSLRTVMSGGEALGADMSAWAREYLGVQVNEIYGQTEANLLVGNSSYLWPVRDGSMGLPFPGHEVAVLGENGERQSPGGIGQIALKMPDPVAFLGYWNRPDATVAKLVNGWLLTGDLAQIDADGYVWFTARDDDIINSAGYRIGPSEIEDCVCSHPAVLMAAAVGIPDKVRGEVVKVFAVLADGYHPTETLKDEIRRSVRSRLAAYESPREIEFVQELPMTTTGKIRRQELKLKK